MKIQYKLEKLLNWNLSQVLSKTVFLLIYYCGASLNVKY